MSTLKKIYDTDRNVSYASTKLTCEHTKQDIESLLAKWGIKKFGWDWDPENDKAELFFELNEKFGQDNLKVPVRIQPPAIWHKKRYEQDKLNLRVALRAMYWYLKNELNWIFASQSRKTAGFLRYVEMGPNENLGEMILKRIDSLKMIAQLPQHKSDESKPVIKLDKEGNYEAE